MAGRLALLFVAGLSILAAGCGKDPTKVDAGPPPKITEEDRAKMEGLSVEEFRRQRALQSANP